MCRRSKTLTWIVGVTILMLVILAGCGGGSDGGSDGGSGNSSSTSNSGSTSGGQASTGEEGGKIAPNGITLSWLAVNRFEGAVRDDWKIFQEIEKKTGVRIEFQTISPQALAERRQILIATNSVTDIIEVSNQEGRENGPEGVFLNLKNYLDIAPNLKKFYENNPEAEALATGADKGLYTIPKLDSYEESNGFDYAWWVRQDVMKTYGLQEPKNMDEFYELLKALKKHHPDSYPLTFQTPLRAKNGIFSALIRPFTGVEGIINFEPREGKYVFAPYHDRFMEALIYMNKLYKEGLLDPEFALITREQWNERLSSGKSFITYFWKADIPLMNETGKAATDDHFDMYVMPPFAAEEEYNYQFSRSIVGGNGFALSANVKDKDKAVRFIDYLVSEEGRNYLSLGILGETYTIEDGKPYFNRDFGPAPYKILREKYGVWYGTITFDSAISRDAWENAMDENFQGIQKMYQPYIVPAPRNFVRTEEELDLEKSKLDNLNQFLEQELAKFIMGNVPINDNTFNQFISQAQKFGVDEIIEMYNNGYERTYGSD
jgi:putative aldouronate transport system substrate-binding protein